MPEGSDPVIVPADSTPAAGLRRDAVRLDQQIVNRRQAGVGMREALGFAMWTAFIVTLTDRSNQGNLG